MGVLALVRDDGGRVLGTREGLVQKAIHATNLFSTTRLAAFGEGQLPQTVDLLCSPITLYITGHILLRKFDNQRLAPGVW